jgi:hypothetical protein
VYIKPSACGFNLEMIQDPCLHAGFLVFYRG